MTVGSEIKPGFKSQVYPLLSLHLCEFEKVSYLSVL